MHPTTLRASILLPLLSLAAATASAQTAYLVDSNLDQLFTVDLTNGNVTLIGSTLNNGMATPADLCWRDDTNELFTIDLSGGEVGTLDTTNGTFNLRWNTNLSGWQAMAWDPVTRLFYLHNQNDLLYTLDPVSGTTTQVGSLGTTSWLVTAMEIDAGGNLWGLDFSGGSIVKIDKTTGVGTATVVARTGIQGLGFDANGRWFAVDTNTDSLYVLDPVAGGAVLIGANPGTQFAKGFAISGTAVQRGYTACADSRNDARKMTFGGGSNIGGTLMLGVEQGSVPAPAQLLFGFSAQQAGPFLLPLDLGPFGAPGCRLYTSTDSIGAPLISGTQVGTPIPNTPGLVGFVVHVQGAVIDSSPSPNALGLVFTDLARAVITN